MINKETFSDQIYESLKQDILCRRIGFGEKLTNRDLQKRYGVSSTPVRDAINRLYLDGFIEEITNAGAKVINFDMQFALEINDIITSLAVNAVGLSRKRSDPNVVIEALEKQIELQQKNADNSDYYIHNNEFHLTFFRFSNNQRLFKLYEQYNILQEILVRYTYGVDSAGKINSIAQHQKILAAYKEDNIVLAQQYMAEHYAFAVDKIEKGF